jgi:hypothetical protein
MIEDENKDLLATDELPDGFQYPGAFLRLVGRGLLYFEPWFVLQGEQLRQRFRGLKDRYPDRILVPFARREDRDDVACWDQNLPGRVVIIHDFTEPGWEQREVLEDFYTWLRRAVEDMIEFDAGEEM